MLAYLKLCIIYLHSIYCWKATKLSTVSHSLCQGKMATVCCHMTWGHITTQAEGCKILATEKSFWKRKVKEAAIKIRRAEPELNRDQGYQLPQVYQPVLLCGPRSCLTIISNVKCWCFTLEEPVSLVFIAWSSNVKCCCCTLEEPVSLAIISWSSNRTSIPCFVVDFVG